LAEYRNPQQEPGGDKRMMTVFAVVFALIILGQIFLFKKTPATQPKTDAAPASQSSATTTQSATPATVTSAAPGKPVTPPPAAPVEAKSASAETETTVENDLYKIVFTNRGGQVKSWILKKYKDDDGHPLDLVNKETVKFGLPLSLYTYDPNLRNQINSALYVASSSALPASWNLTTPTAESPFTRALPSAALTSSRLRPLSLRTGNP
jgi:YidC/Oxa1 family membrane protein insertase